MKQDDIDKNVFHEDASFTTTWSLDSVSYTHLDVYKRQQKKVNLTGSVGVVDSKSLEARPITNLSQGLQGVVPVSYTHLVRLLHACGEVVPQ